MNLRSAVEGQEYIIKNITTNDEELDSFLFTLGCYSGERSGCVVSIKEGRYSIDNPLAEAITVE